MTFTDDNYVVDKERNLIHEKISFIITSKNSNYNNIIKNKINKIIKKYKSIKLIKIKENNEELIMITEQTDEKYKNRINIKRKIIEIIVSIDEKFLKNITITIKGINEKDIIFQKILKKVSLNAHIINTVSLKYDTKQNLALKNFGTNTSNMNTLGDTEWFKEAKVRYEIINKSKLTKSVIAGFEEEKEYNTNNYSEKLNNEFMNQVNSTKEKDAVAEAEAEAEAEEEAEAEKESESEAEAEPEADEEAEAEPVADEEAEY